MIRQFINENFRRGTEPQTQTRKPRIEFIDLAKGICILLVVLNHTHFETVIPNFQALRMPLYFVLSGLFFRDYGGFFNLLIRKVYKLMVPFLFFFLFSFGLSYVINIVLKHTMISLEFLLTPLRSEATINYSLWFLMSLFWCNVIWWGIGKISKAILRIISVIACAVLGFLLREYGLQLPFYLRSSLIAMPFFYMGTLIAATDYLRPHRYDRYLAPAAVIFLGVAYLFFYFAGKPSINIFYASHNGSILLAYINSALMVAGTMLFCKLIKMAACNIIYRSLFDNHLGVSLDYSRIFTRGGGNVFWDFDGQACSISMHHNLVLAAYTCCEALPAACHCARQPGLSGYCGYPEINRRPCYHPRPSTMNNEPKS